MRWISRSDARAAVARVDSFEHHSHAAAYSARRNRGQRPSGRVLTRLGFTGVWLRRLQLRHELAQLDAQQLRDAGLNAQTIHRECAKWFWQA